MVVRYEDLCDRPRETLALVLAHARLPVTEPELEGLAARLSPPGYYAPGFSEAEEAIIAEETAEARGRLGYA